MDSREANNTNGKIESGEDVSGKRKKIVVINLFILENLEGNLDDPNGKIKRKRRSKNDAEGRSFKCSECGKSYLSQPALTNHKKTKHGYGTNGEKK